VLRCQILYSRGHRATFRTVSEGVFSETHIHDPAYCFAPAGIFRACRLLRAASHHYISWHRIKLRNLERHTTGSSHILISCPPATIWGLKVRDGPGEEILLFPLTARTDNAPKVRFSATLGQEPEIELFHFTKANQCL
jgi:hypothetical protein